MTDNGMIQLIPELKHCLCYINLSKTSCTTKTLDCLLEHIPRIGKVVMGVSEEIKLFYRQKFININLS